MREPSRTKRPWGSYEVLDTSSTHQVKRIVVRPGRRLSYQVHERRSEHWFVVEGEGVVTLDGELVVVKAGQAVDVPVAAAHRIENTGERDLVFIEVQHGEYFGEEEESRRREESGRSCK